MSAAHELPADPDPAGTATDRPVADRPSLHVVEGGPEAAASGPIQLPMGAVEVAAHPPNAQILLSGSRVGVGRVSLPVSPGLYRLEVRAPGFAPHVAMLRVEDGMVSEVEIALETAPPRPTLARGTAPQPSNNSGYVKLAFAGGALALLGGLLWGIGKSQDEEEPMPPAPPPRRAVPAPATAAEADRDEDPAPPRTAAR